MKKEHASPSVAFFSLVFLALAFFAPHLAHAHDEGVFTYLGTVDNSKCREISDREGEYLCLRFEKKNSQNKMYLWVEQYIYDNKFERQKNIDLLVAYRLSDTANYFLAAIPNPDETKTTKQKVTYLGYDTYAPDYASYRFALANGKETMYICLGDFCNDLDRYINKKIEIELKDEYFYHDGGEAYAKAPFIRSFKPLP